MSADAAGPQLLLLNEGLALRERERWTFLCPSLWGNTATTIAKVPLATAADSRVAWVVGKSDLYALADGRFAAQTRPELDASHVILLASNARDDFALVITDTGTAITRVNAPNAAPIWTSTQSWASFAANGEQLLVARVSDDRQQLIWVTLNERGESAGEQRVALGLSASEADLRPTPGQLFATLFDGDQYLLGTISAGTWRIIARSNDPWHGPIAVGSTLWAASGGQLMRATALDRFEPIAGSAAVSCLGQFGALAYACATSELYTLTDNGLGARNFALQGLYGPDPALVPAAAKDDCGAQWFLYKNDLKLAGYAPNDWGEAAAATAGAPELSMPAAGTHPAAGAGGAGSDPSAANGCSCTTIARRHRHDCAIATAWTIACLFASRRRRRARS